MLVDFSKFKEPTQSYDFPGMKLFRIVFDQTTKMFRVLCKSRNLEESLREAFSAENKGAFFASRYGYDVDPKVYMINIMGLFRRGLIFDVLKYMKRMYGNLEVVSVSECARAVIDEDLRPWNPVAKGLDKETWEPLNISDDSGKNDLIMRKAGTEGFKYRPYQKEAIRKLIFDARGRGMIEIPTAGGKSFIIANFVYNGMKLFEPESKVLVLVPNKQLVVQMYRDFLTYGWKKEDLTMMTAGKVTLDDFKFEKFNPDAKVIFANRQYVIRNVDKLPPIGMLFVDECHTATADATSNFIDNLDCSVKVGCSGTVPVQGEDRYKLIGMLGPLVYQEHITMLQSSGFISEVIIHEINVVDENVTPDHLFHLHPKRKYNPEKPGDIEFDEAYKDEIEYMNRNFKREYSPILDIIVDYKDNTLVLFDRLDFGRGMFELAKEHGMKGRKIYYIDGKTDVSERERIRDSFEKDGNNILFAQAATMSTGTNIKRLSNLVMAFRTKSTTRVIQSIGRILRLHENKEVATVVDIRFNMKYSDKHYKERLGLYGRFYRKKPCRSYSVTIHKEKQEARP